MSGAALHAGPPGAGRAGSLLPQPPGGNGPGAVLALLAHVGLVLALTHAVDWRNQKPEVLSAELWAAVPEAAAPAPTPAPPPPPPPAPPPPAPAPVPAPPVAAPAPPPPAPPPDIVLEQERQRQAELRRAQQEAEAERRRQAAERKAQAEKERAEKAEADKRRAEQQQAERLAAQRKAEEERRKAEAEERAEEERLAQQREANLRRIMGQAAAQGTAPGTGTGARSAGPSAGYAAKIVNAVRPQIKFSGTLPPDAVATVEVTAAPGGSIIARKLLKSSGHPAWDAAVMRAIERTERLPRDTDGRVPSPVVIDFRWGDQSER